MEMKNYFTLKDIAVKTATLSDFTDTLEQKLDIELVSILNSYCMNVCSHLADGISQNQIEGINAREWMIDNYNSIKGSIRMVNLVLSDINDKLDKLELDIGIALENEEYDEN